jgi:hypothetical protein
MHENVAQRGSDRTSKHRNGLREAGGATDLERLWKHGSDYMRSAAECEVRFTNALLPSLPSIKKKLHDDRAGAAVGHESTQSSYCLHECT